MSASSSAATIRAWRRRPGRIPTLGVDVIVRGEGDLTFRELVRAFEQRQPLVGDRRPVVSRRRRVPRQRRIATWPGSIGETIRPPQPRRPRAHRLHDDGPPRRRRGNVARLHLRLQLLLDHRNARPQLPPVPDRARDRRHRATRMRAARGASSSSTTTSRSTSSGSKRSATPSSRPD